MNRDDLNDVQHLTARIVALETLVKLLLGANASRSADPADMLATELRNIKTSAQNVQRPIDPASDAIWDEAYRSIERIYRDVQARFPPSA